MVKYTFGHVIVYANTFEEAITIYNEVKGAY